MLKYSDYKRLNESMGSHTLGVKSTNAINQLHSRWDEAGLPMKRKKMFAGGGEDGLSGEPNDMGGGDGGMAPPMKKKKKPMMKPPEPEEDDRDDGDDMEDDDDSDDYDDQDSGGDEDQDTDDEGSDEDDEEGGEETPDFAKKPAKPLMKKQPRSLQGPDDQQMGQKFMSKGCGKGCKCKACMKKMKEDYEFWHSLKDQTGFTQFAQDESGFFMPVTEDAIIAPTDPNAGISEDEPQPGDIGFAPVGKLNNVAGFTEWANKKKKGKKLMTEQKKRKTTWFS